MTIATPPTPLSYSGNGSTTSFPVSWKYNDKAHVVATLRSSTGVETVWVLTTNYTLTDPSDTGTLTAIVAPATGTTLIITLEPPNTQSTDLPIGGDFPSTSVEDGLDLAAQRDGYLLALFNRSLRVPKSDTQAGSLLDIPIDSSRANKFLAFDANGNPITSVGTGADAGLRGDLADTTDAAKGDALVGVKRSESGAQAFTLHAYQQSRDINVLSDFIPSTLHLNIKSGTSTVDVYAYIQAAIDAAELAGGADLWFPGGSVAVYNIGTRLTVEANGVGLKGAARLRRLSGATIASVLHVGATTGTAQYSGNVIDGLTFDGNSGCTEAVLKIRNQTLSDFRNLIIKSGSAIGLKTETSTTSVNTNQLRNNYTNLRIASNVSDGAIFIGEKDSCFVDIRSHNNTGNGITFRAFKDDANTLAETTECLLGVLSARDNGGDGFVFDGVEKYVASSLLSAINGGYGYRFRSTDTGAVSVALNSIQIANLISRNDNLGGLRISDSAQVLDMQVGTALIRGPNQTVGVEGVRIDGASRINFGTLIVVSNQGTAIRIRKGTPLGATTEASNIEFSNVILVSNGINASSANHGISIEDSTSDIFIGSLRSANSETNGPDYELNFSATAGPIFIGQAHLSANSSGNELNINSSDTHFGRLKIGTGPTSLWIKDGITAPSSSPSSVYAQMYIDTADGDLKIRFGDSTIKTIVIDT